MGQQIITCLHKALPITIDMIPDRPLCREECTSRRAPIHILISSSETCHSLHCIQNNLCHCIHTGCKQSNIYSGQLTAQRRAFLSYSMLAKRLHLGVLTTLVLPPLCPLIDYKNLHKSALELFIYQKTLFSIPKFFGGYARFFLSCWYCL